MGIAQGFQGTFIASQLAVPTGLGGGDPDQGIEPIDAQANATNQSPDVIAVTQMGLLVGQNVGPGLFDFSAGRGQINNGAEQSHYAGSRDIGTDSNAPTAKIGSYGILFGPVQEHQVGGDKPASHGAHSDNPHCGKNFSQSGGGDLRLHLCFNGLLHLRCHIYRPVGQGRDLRGIGSGIFL